MEAAPVSCIQSSDLASISSSTCSSGLKSRSTWRLLSSLGSPPAEMTEDFLSPRCCDETRCCWMLREPDPGEEEKISAFEIKGKTNARRSLVRSFRLKIKSLNFFEAEEI